MTRTRAVILVVLVANVALFGLHWMGVFGDEGTSRLERRWERPPEGATEVLFVGNSHTFNHDVPGVVQHLGAARGDDVWVETVAGGGMELAQHARLKKTRRALEARDWDVVVLQNSSVTPALGTDAFLEAVETLVRRVREGGARPILYATWTQAKWHDMYRQEAFPFTPSSLRRALIDAYRRADDIEGLEVAPVVTAFREFRRGSEQVRLLSDDGNHATAEGAYLAASVVYRRLSGKSVQPAAFVPYDIDPSVAAQLRRIADRSVRDWDRNADESGEATSEQKSRGAAE